MTGKMGKAAFLTAFIIAAFSLLFSPAAALISTPAVEPLSGVITDYGCPGTSGVPPQQGVNTCNGYCSSGECDPGDYGGSGTCIAGATCCVSLPKPIQPPPQLTPYQQCVQDAYSFGEDSAVCDIILQPSGGGEAATQPTTTQPTTPTTTAPTTPAVTVTGTSSNSYSTTYAYSDGSTTTVYIDGTDVTTYPDGSTVTYTLWGEAYTTPPTTTTTTTPSTTTATEPSTTTTTPSTTTSVTSNDYSQTYQNSDGSTTIIYVDGTVIDQYPDGSTATYDQLTGNIYTTPPTQPESSAVTAPPQPEPEPVVATTPAPYYDPCGGDPCCGYCWDLWYYVPEPVYVPPEPVAAPAPAPAPEPVYVPPEPEPVYVAPEPEPDYFYYDPCGGDPCCGGCSYSYTPPEEDYYTPPAPEPEPEPAPVEDTSSYDAYADWGWDWWW